MMTLTEHEKAEFKRFSIALLEKKNWVKSCQFSAYTGNGKITMPIKEFDAAKSEYRAWLVFNEYPKNQF